MHDVIIPTNHSFWILERLDNVRPVIRNRKWTLKVVHITSVATGGNDAWDVVVYAPADGEEYDVPCYEEGGHEKSEEDVTNCGEAEVFEAFCKLKISVSKNAQRVEV